MLNRRTTEIRKIEHPDRAMSFGKNRARLSTDADKKVTFAQVAGLQEEKEELEEVVDFLKAPKKYIQVDATHASVLRILGCSEIGT